MPTPTPDPLPSYWQRSRQPLQGLFFLLPMIVLYELGTLVYATDHANGVIRFIYARSLLSDFFELLGATGYYLPGLIVGIVLLSWHLVRGDPWRMEPRLYLSMWIEAVILALPLLVYALVLFRQPSQQAVGVDRVVAWLENLVSLRLAAGPDQWQTQLVFSIGAGIYEELLFRLIGIALLHLLLVDVLALPHRLGAAMAVFLSALAFALYHFSENNPFALTKCLFYVGAGIYFAAVYVIRGFGIVAGTHAVYDVIVVVLQTTHSQSA